MLENIDLSKTLKKKEGKELLEKLDTEVAALQRQARELKIPVMVVFEGWGASGKGRLINRMIQPLDPRGFKVHSIQKATQRRNCIPICGGSGIRFLPGEECTFLTEAGIPESCGSG